MDRIDPLVLRPHAHTYIHMYQSEPQINTHIQKDDSELYIRNCARYGMKVDPSIVIALRTK